VTFEERREQATGFASRLWRTLEQDRGASVELRRLLTPAPVPTRAYWQLDPPSQVWPRELPMWLAGLAATRPRSIARPRREPERPGQALRRARDLIVRERRGSAVAFERQVSELLTCHPDDLRRDLVPVMELAQRVGVRFDYGVLLLDLSQWDDPTRRVQRRWAEDLWAPRTEKSSSTLADHAAKETAE
jgi:CRISPR type I-E-associated protein CasB/Cse2